MPSFFKGRLRSSPCGFLKKMYQTILIEPIANGLILFYRVLWGNMGLAIITFTVFLRFLLNPLTKPYFESMKKMKEVGPQLEKIKERHKGDKAKYLKAQADFYKEKGVNPGAGCLPYLLQIVVLIAFFNVFSRTLSPGVDSITKFNELLYPPLQFSEGETLNTSFLYLNVNEPDVFKVAGLPFPLPGPFLLLAALVQLVSAKITAPFVEAQEKAAKKTKEQSDDIQVAMQQSMVYTFPLITLVIGIQFSSALVLYWLLFSLFQAVQQYRSSGWGGMTPWLRKVGLLKSQSSK